MKRLIAAIVLVSFFVVFLGVGCRSNDYYRDQAVGRARAFLLEDERAKKLTVEQRSYVRYNKPVIMAEHILGEYYEAKATGISSTLSQICVVWLIPDETDAYVVFGVGGSSMIDWSPNRLIIKRYEKVDKNRIGAIHNAMIYAMDNLLYLSLAQRNRIRFGIPEIRSTKFILDLTNGGKNTPKKINRLKQLKQTTFIWDSIKPGKKVVVSGLGGKHGLDGWQAFMGLEITDADLEKHIVKGD